MRPRGDPNHRPANWPPFPKKCPTPFKPCFRHDFKNEMPSFGYKIALEAYYLWMFTGVAYFWNFIVSLAALNTSVSGTSQAAGISCAYMVLGTPCAYCCWFHHLYTAFRTDSSFRYGWWFFVTFMHFLFSCFMVIGIPSTGAAGIWVATSAMSDNKVIGIMGFTSAIMWIFNALWSLWLCRRVLGVYRQTGQSMEKAQGELNAAGQRAMYDAVTSEAGQAAVKGAAVSWASQQGDSNA